MKVVHQKGVTLIELMIVVVIIGILGAIAYPTYTQFLLSGNRSAAQQWLLELSTRQQQYLLDNRMYAQSDPTINVTAGIYTLLGGLIEPVEVTTHYTISFNIDNTATPPSYTITATPDKGTTQATDGAININHIGNKSPIDKW